MYFTEGEILRCTPDAIRARTAAVTLSAHHPNLSESATPFRGLTMSLRRLPQSTNRYESCSSPTGRKPAAFESDTTWGSSGGRPYQILPKNPAVLASSNILQFTFQFVSLTTMDEISAIVIDNGSGSCKAGCKSYCLQGVVYL